MSVRKRITLREYCRGDETIYRESNGKYLSGGFRTNNVEHTIAFKDEAKGVVLGRSQYCDLAHHIAGSWKEIRAKSVDMVSIDDDRCVVVMKDQQTIVDFIAQHEIDGSHPYAVGEFYHRVQDNLLKRFDNTFAYVVLSPTYAAMLALVA